MAYYANQPPLNGAYYGPPIPPPKSYHRPSSGGRGCCSRCGCCLVDCLCDCGFCLLGCLFKILCSLLLFVAAIALVLWLILRRYEVAFYASDASLAYFNYSDHQLSYDFALNFTARNPNRHIGVYYDVFEANAIYEGQRFSMAEVAPFFQEPKTSREIGPVVFKGHTALSLGSDRSFNQPLESREFDIAVKLYLKVRLKLGFFKTGKIRPKFRCDLTVPLKSSSSAAKFTSTRCNFVP